MTTATPPAVSPPTVATTTGTWVPAVVRVASHCTVWVSVLVSLGVELAHGWRPVGDNAAITARAFQMLTTHPPVLGLLSTAGSTGHPVYDPGPLLFWLLAVPVHLDPTHGALWGAALLAGVTLSVAIEALWSARLWPACGILALAVADMFWLTPSVFENIAWNAYFPLPFFIATLALTWVVGTGRFGWWPVLVFTASVAAQSHLLFSIPCTLLALAAPVIAVAVGTRPPRLRWLWAGLGVAAACWLAPLLQQVFGGSGNISALFGSQSGQHALGSSFALSVIGRIGHLPPIWLTHQPTDIYALGAFETTAKAVTGIILLVLLAATAAWAVVSHRRALAALAVTGFVASVGFVAAVAIFPYAKALSLYYLLDLLWPLGIMIWATVGWGVCSVVAAASRRRVHVPNESANGPGGRYGRPWTEAASLLVVLAIAVMCILGIHEAAGAVPSENTVSWDSVDAASIANIAAAIEHRVPPGPVEFRITGGTRSLISDLWISEGVGWKLKSDGWSPGLDQLQSEYTGLSVPAGAPFTAVGVSLDGTSVTSLTTVHCHTTVAACLHGVGGNG